MNDRDMRELAADRLRVLIRQLTGSEAEYQRAEDLMMRAVWDSGLHNIDPSYDTDSDPDHQLCDAFVGVFNLIQYGV